MLQGSIVVIVLVVKELVNSLHKQIAQAQRYELPISYILHQAHGVSHIQAMISKAA